MTDRTPWGLLLLVVVLLAVLCGLSLVAGKVWIPWDAWFSHDLRWAIIAELRLPRTILAVFVGASLAMCGAAFQGYTRNPMADPGILGVSSSASFGAVLTLYMGMGASSVWLLATGGMLGALIGTSLLILMSGATSSVLTFLLAGLFLNTIASSLTALALNLAPTPWAVNEIVNWLLGSLADRSFDEVTLALPFMVIGMGILLFTGRTLDALTLGESTARSMGVHVNRARLLIVLGVGLAVGASVAVTGSIGFVGLFTPHMVRPFVGSRPSATLIPSALVGAVIVLAADIAVRVFPSTVELKLGVAMAVLGGPFFLARLMNVRRTVA